MTGRCNMMMAQHAVILCSITVISTQVHDLCHKRWKYARLHSSVLGYVYVSAGADIKLVELVGEHTILCDYKDADCTVQENINLGKHQDNIT